MGHHRVRLVETDRHLVGAPALVETARWAPWWVSVLLCILLTLGGAAIVYEYAGPHRTDVYWRGLLAGLPLMALLAYGALLFAFNKTVVRVVPGNVEVHDGPVPAGLPPRRFPMQDLDTCYYRTAVNPGRFGAVRVYVAGVQLRAGEWVDLLAEFDSIEQARAAAERIAAAVSAGAVPSLAVRDFSSLRPRVERANFVRLIASGRGHLWRRCCGACS